jgi:multiple sugar transport system substrate-binding protein
MTKEDAFRVALSLFSERVPQVLIAASENIAKGIREAASVAGIAQGAFIMIIFSEETWLNRDEAPGIFRTARPAFLLGQSAGKELIRLIERDAAGPVLNLRFPDKFEAGFPLPGNVVSKAHWVPTGTGGRVLRLLVPDTNSSRALKQVSAKLAGDTGLELRITSLPASEVHREMLRDIFSGESLYDVYMFDAPWLNYFAQTGCLSDISDFIQDNRDIYSSIVRENLEAASYNGRYFSIPFLGGAQLLFYRRDLFEDPQAGKSYFNQNNNPLRPPRTWREFNRIARFFSRRLNPASPVEYGASCAGATSDELCPELYIRIWGFGGQVFDRQHRPSLYSRYNIEAFNNLLELGAATPAPIFQTNSQESLDAYCQGRTAMLIAWTEYASKIVNAQMTALAGKTGWALVPCRTPAAFGWNLGLSAFSRARDAALTFFEWLCRRDVNYYLTILNGQSVSTYPYQNQELLKLYPWMRTARENFKYSRQRVFGDRRNLLMIPKGHIEDIIYRHTLPLFQSPSTSPQVTPALQAMDTEIKAHNQVYQR